MNALDPDIVAGLATGLPRTDLVRILRAFENDLARLAGEFVEAKGDAAVRNRAAHALAGTAAGIGARRLEALARLALAPGPAESLAELARRIEDETVAALAELAGLAAG